MEEKKLTSNQRYRRLLCRYTFSTYKNLRKTTLKDIQQENAKHKGSTIQNSYKDFEYYVVWREGSGITSYVFKNGKMLSYSGRLYEKPEYMIRLTEKYIDYLSPRYETFMKNKQN